LYGERGDDRAGQIPQWLPRQNTRDKHRIQRCTPNTDTRQIYRSELGHGLVVLGGGVHLRIGQ
jgi:hypothetical protein